MGDDEAGAFDDSMTAEKLQQVEEQYQERVEGDEPEQQQTAESGLMFPQDAVVQDDDDTDEEEES